MRTTLTTTAAATIALALVGCGSGSDDDAAPAASTAPPAATSTAAAPAASTETTTSAAAPASSSSSSSEPTAMGSTLKQGESAVVVYDDTIHHHSSAVRITPHPIEAGTLDDFKNIKLDADQKTSAPFYVKVDVVNVGKEDLSGASPGSYLNGIDDRGQNQNEVIFFGDFPKCTSKIPKSLKPGESYKTCLTYLVPGGGSLKGMRWIAFDQKTGKSNIDWK
jgi:hypothetical protein